MALTQIHRSMIIAHVLPTAHAAPSSMLLVIAVVQSAAAITNTINYYRNLMLLMGSIFEKAEAVMTNMTIGQLAKRSGTSIDTVRFYERKNLIAPAYRKQSGYRQFDQQAVDTIAFICHAKGLGFTLKEIEELLFIRQNPHAMAVEVKQRVREKIADIDAKVERLSQIREELSALGNMCGGVGPASLCPILEAMESTESEKDLS